MLDSLTDRMWYLVGAVFIGAFLLGAVWVGKSDTINSAGDLIAVVASGGEPGENVIQQDMIYEGRNNGNMSVDVDKSSYARNNMVVVDQGNHLWSGLQIRVPHGELEPESTYVLSYSYQKLAGTLESFGGHTSDALHDNDVFVNGEVSPGIYHDTDSVYTGDHTNKTDVEVVIQTPPENQMESSGEAEIWIQPNRGVAGATAKVAVYGLSFNKVD